LDTKGFILYKLGRYEESIECFDKAISANPNDPTFSEHRKLALAELTKTDHTINVQQN
jgi:tetratricopeptide (TPR) repeat protein